MPSDLIRVDYDALKDVSARFGRQAGHVTELQRHVGRSVQALQSGGWEGKGAAAFFQEMNSEIVPALRQLFQALEQAKAVTLQIHDIMKRAEEEAAVPFRGAPTAAIGFTDKQEEDGFWDGVKDFFGGMYAEGEDMVAGLWNLVTDPVGTAKGLWYGITHPGELWDAIKKPYVDDWNSGHPWRAIGRGTMAVVTTVLGTKGADKVAKALKGATVADDVARVGSIADDAARAGSIADDAARAGTVADDAARAGTVADDALRVTGTVDDMAQSILRESTEQVSSRNSLVTELTENGIKHTPDEIVAITRDGSGRVVFLETGTTGQRAAGLKHILQDHAADFARRGIPPREIPNVLMNAVEQGKIVGYQGRGMGRPIYEVMYQGKPQHIAITVADNGYIVGANPATLP